MKRFVVAVLLLSLSFLNFGCADKDKGRQGAGDITVSTPAAPPAIHTVVKGDFLRKIAEQYDVFWESILLANEHYLAQKYEETCARLSARYRNRPGRKGSFCNDRLRRPYGNTLLPGWKLTIPQTEAPAPIAAAVGALIPPIALVIDDTGSMTNDRERVAEFYLAAIKAHRKELVGVWLFADGKIRRYESGGVRFLTEGSQENTFGALAAASRENPASIILVTDEPGDDWDWKEAAELPPVLCHCLADKGFHCGENLRRLAKITHGQYREGL